MMSCNRFVRGSGATYKIYKRMPHFVFQLMYCRNFASPNWLQIVTSDN